MTIGGILGASWEAIASAVIATIVIYLIVIVGTRLSGLRTFAKMSSFDFAATIATGSILASVALTSAPLVLGVVSVAALLATQKGVAVIRQRRTLDRVMDNTPVLLMDGPRYLEANMRATQLTRADIVAKLREANVTRLEQVRYVVLETTGDVSVLHQQPGDPPVEDVILEGVIRDVTAP